MACLTQTRAATPHRAVLPYVAALDGVRGIAVAAVLLFHGGHLVGGYLGVDLFFVLSGFLITSLLLMEGEAAGSIRLGSFWARRARRLLPALAGLLVGVAFFCAAFADPGELAEIRADAWATMLYVPNWRAVFAERDYWALFRAPSPLQHTWSLGIEEQFYLAWPLAFAGLLRRCGKATPKVALVVSLLLAGASAACMWILYEPENISRVYYGSDTRAAAILLGAALAAWHSVWGPARSRWGRVLVEVAGTAGLVVLAVAWWRLDGESPALYRGGLVLCGVAGVAVIAAAVHPHRGAVSRVLAWQPLRLLGVISYGVYLWHWPVYLVFDEERTGLTGWALLGVRVAFTLLAAVASYVVVERPIHRGALSGRQWGVIGPGITVAIVAAILSTTARSGSGPSAASGTTETLPHVQPGTTAQAQAVAAPVRILVLGDSVGISLFRGLEHVPHDHNLEVSLGVQIGCARDSTRPDCPPPWETQVTRLKPDVVLLAESGIWTVWALRVGSQVAEVGTPAWDEAWIAQRQEIVNELIAAGAKRLAITTMPCIKDGSIRNAQRRLAARNMAHANVNLSALAARNPERVQLIDLAAYVCPKGEYQRSLGSVDTVRDDGVHYSPEGEDLVGRWLAPQLARAGLSASSR